jgi:LmbE family N-acetylglucosaminyl deacetylase
VTSPTRRRRRGWIKIGLTGLGVLVVSLFAFYRWQPWEYEVFPAPRPLAGRLDPDSSRLFSKGTRVLVVTAHPDDAEFYIGGLLTKLGRAGCWITLVCVTDGDKGYYPFEDAEANRRVRRREQADAARAWGASEVVYLGFPDGRLKVTDEVVDTIHAELLRLTPEYILTFDGEHPTRLRHRDHRRTGVAVERALRQTPIGSWLLRFSTSSPNYAVDIGDVWENKMRLVAIHASQFYGERLRRIRSLLRSRAEADARLLGSELAEGLRVSRLPL